MVYVIEDTADIYCFCKNWYKTAQGNLHFKLPPVSFKQIEKFLYFPFKAVKNFSNSKPRPPGQRKLGEFSTCQTLTSISTYYFTISAYFFLRNFYTMYMI